MTHGPLSLLTQILNVLVAGMHEIEKYDVIPYNLFYPHSHRL